VGDTNVFFRIASDWGSANAGQEVKYTIALRNTRSAGDANNLSDLLIRSTLPSNLEVLGASSDRGVDPTVAGNDVQLRIATLKPGETIELTVRTRIKPKVARGTLIVSQAQATYAGLAQALFSNVVTVLVVDAAPTSAATAVAQAGTATSTVAPPTNTAQIVATGTSTVVGATSTQGSIVNQAATATGVVLPTATVAPTTPTAPLPNTSTGVPILGFALLGLTMLVRTVRLHRVRERI
jgi:hypothetical protein